MISRKNTGYKERQVFDIVCIEIAYTTVIMLQKFKRMPTPYYVSNIKAEPHIRQFSKNRRERWVRIGEQVMCRLVYSYILTIRHYAPNTFSALPNFQKRRILARILANTVCESQFSRLLVNLCENTRERRQIFGIRLFSEDWRMWGFAFI